MNRPRSLPHLVHCHTATSGARTDALLHGGGRGRPASPASLVPEPFSPRLSPEEAGVLLHGPGATGGFATSDASLTHQVVPSFLTTPCPTSSQDPGMETHLPTHPPCGYVLQPHSQGQAKARKAKSARLRQRRQNEMRALETELEELLMETETLEAEKRRLVEVTNLMQQHLGHRGQAGAWQTNQPPDIDAAPSLYS